MFFFKFKIFYVLFQNEIKATKKNPPQQTNKKYIKKIQCKCKNMWATCEDILLLLHSFLRI